MTTVIIVAMIDGESGADQEVTAEIGNDTTEMSIGVIQGHTGLALANDVA